MGIGCRLPGGVSNADDLWELLLGGTLGLRSVPADRWNNDQFYSEERGAPGTYYISQGGFLDQDVFAFEPEAFGITEAEALGLDPMHRLLLEVHRDALEHAGMPTDDLEETRTGVYVGMAHSEHKVRVHARGADAIDVYTGTGNTSSTACGRIAYWLGTRGPTWAVDTACSSSLVAVHQAIQDLRSGACDLALASGVNVLLDPDAFVYLCTLRALAPDGRSKTFQANADGYGRGEGAAAVVLKRLSEALRDGDQILATLRGSAVNHDGRSNGLTAPSGTAQRAVIAQALANAQVAPEDVRWVECHGTGTALGDPIEVQALVEAYGPPADHPLTITAIKANIGHLEAAAGMAGLLKLVLSFHHGRLPPQPMDGPLNPLLHDTPIRIPTHAEDLPGTLAATSAFGIGGTNVHLLVERAPVVDARQASASGPHSIALTADSDTGWMSLRDAWKRRLGSGGPIAGLSETSWRGRSHGRWRATVVANDASEAHAQLQTLRPTKTQGLPPRVLFAFTGQGSQYANMAGDLYTQHPSFRDALDRCAETLAAHLNVPLMDILHDERLLQDTRYTQPALAAVAWSLVCLWRAWGVIPEAVVGHSIGEWVAAAAAGVISPEDMLRAVTARGAQMGSLPQGGAMAAVRGDPEEIGALVNHPAISTAAINHPAEVVLSGEEAALLETLKMLAAHGFDSRQLNVSHAFHSHLMDPALEALETAFGVPAYAAPRMPFVSARTGQLEVDAWTQPEHWRRAVREPVLFAKALRAAAEHSEILLEIGPSPVLCGMAARTTQQTAVPTLVRGASASQSFLEAVGRLWEAGVPVKPPPLGDRDHSAPLTPFVRRRLSQMSRPHSTPQWVVDWEAANKTSDGPLRVHEVTGKGPLADALNQQRAAEGASVWIDPGGGSVDRAADALVFLQRMAHEHNGRPVLLVTRGATFDAPLAAGVHGLCRTARLEWPDLNLRLVDIQPDVSATALLYAAGAHPSEPTLRVSLEATQVPRLRPHTPPPATFHAQEGIWVITGGLGALGMHTARWLIQRGATHLLLVSRSAKGERAKRAVDDLQTDRCEVRVAACDVSDQAAVLQLLDVQPSVRGIIHAAGILEDESLETMDPGAFDRVGKSKVCGAIHLMQAVKHHDLSLQAMILYSSLASVTGSPGQGNYAAVNATLDALAQGWRAEGWPCLSISWGPWAGEGMAQPTANRHEQEGFTPIDAEPAFRALASALASTRSHVAIARADWTSACARLGQVPALLSSLVTQQAAATGTPRAAELQTIIARVLGVTQALPMDESLAALGMDSVQATELARALGVAIGRNLSPTIAWDHPTSQALVDHLLGGRTPETNVTTDHPSAQSIGPHAIAGWALRVPGATSPEALWQHWESQTHQITPFPRDRWDKSAWRHNIAATAGGFLDDVRSFDPEAFGMTPREARTLDPQHRLLLELTWEALLDANIDPKDTRGQSVGVFIGLGGSDYARLLAQAGLLDSEPHAGSGNDGAFAAGRIAHTFGWRGPTLTVSNTCPSGLTALHLAKQALRDGSCERALVAAAHLSLAPEPFAYQTHLEALSIDGQTRSFSASANGYGRSEGGAALFLGPPDDKRSARALLAGTATEHVGRSATLTAPSGPPQEHVVRRALRDAQLDASDITYIEAHGTGRPTSDAIELGALGAVYGDRERPTAIGCVKTIIGHTEVASGLVGLIAACLVGQQRRAPAHLFHNDPSPALQRAGLHLCDGQEALNGPIAVHAYGLSGSVAHAILLPGVARNTPTVRPPFNKRPVWFGSTHRPGRRLTGPTVRFARRLEPQGSIGDHQLGGRCVVSAAEWIAWVLAASTAADMPYHLKDISFQHAAVVPAQGLNAQLQILSDHTWQIDVEENGSWTCVARGSLCEKGTADKPPSPCATDAGSENLYQMFANKGQDFGQGYRCLQRVGVSGLNVTGLLSDAPDVAGILDAGMQLRAARDTDTEVRLPFSIDAVHVVGDLNTATMAILQVMDAGPSDPTWVHNIWWLNSAQEVVFAMTRQTSVARQAPRGRRLLPDASGMLDRLQWLPFETPPLGSSDVRIHIRAAGLNFRDVLAALGSYPGPSQSLGAECVGVVTEAGEESGYTAGDRVLAFGPATLATDVTLPSHAVVPAPDGWDDHTLAGVPVVFLTAWVALKHIAKLKSGETVLIHAAAGGVGMAAVQVARHLGATVLGTAHPRKWSALKEHGITQLANSRDQDFHLQLSGPVDVLLNSLTGSFIDNGMTLLADNGRFIELGKRDLRDASETPPSVRYSTFDLGIWAHEHPTKFQTAFRDVLNKLQEQAFSTLPTQTFAFSEATQAFRFMAQAKHIGKVVLTPDVAAKRLQSKPSPWPTDREAIRRELQRIVAHLLGTTTAPDVHTPLRDAGVDSLLAIELRNHLALRTNRQLEATFVFAHPTLEAIANALQHVPSGDTPRESAEDLLQALEFELQGLEDTT